MHKHFVFRKNELKNSRLKIKNFRVQKVICKKIFYISKSAKLSKYKKFCTISPASRFVQFVTSKCYRRDEGESLHPNRITHIVCIKNPKHPIKVYKRIPTHLAESTPLEKTFARMISPETFLPENFGPNAIITEKYNY